MELSDYDLSGYEVGTPPTRGLIDGPRIDKEIAETHPCTVCGGKMGYHPYVNRDYTSYRAFAVCTKCGNAIEF